jgi:hypothetical protein
MACALCVSTQVTYYKGDAKSQQITGFPFHGDAPSPKKGCAQPKHPIVLLVGPSIEHLPTD